MTLPTISGEFRVVDDPELRFSPSGQAIGSIRLMAKKQKKQGDEWVDDKILWINGTVWGKPAERVAESVRKGDNVVIVGTINTEEWNDRNTGDKRSAVALTINEIGLSLRWSNYAKVEGDGSSQARPQQTSRPAQTNQQANPWGNASANDDPPF